MAQARAGPSTSTASSSNAWAGAELWCEKKAGDLFCLLCNKFASEAHLQCKMHLSRLQDPGSWLEWQRAEAEAQQRRAEALQRVAESRAVVPWTPPQSHAVSYGGVPPATGGPAPGAAFHVQLDFYILGRRDPWDETRMSFSTSPCAVSIQSEHTPACHPAGGPLMSLSPSPCYDTGNGTHLTIHFGGALSVCTASEGPEEVDAWGGSSSPRTLQEARLPPRAAPKAVRGVAPVPNLRARAPGGPEPAAVTCSDLFPHAHVFHGLDFPDTLPTAATPITDAGRPVDGLRDAIRVGVPANGPGTTGNTARLTFRVQGYRALSAAWRQHATLGELFLEAIRNETHINAALSIGIMGRLRFVLGGLHLTSSAKVLNYSSSVDIVVYIAAVGGARGASTEPPSESEAEGETLHYGQPYSLAEPADALGPAGRARGAGLQLDDPVLSGSTQTQLEVRIYRQLEFRHAATALLAGRNESDAEGPAYGAGQAEDAGETTVEAGPQPSRQAEYAAPIPKAAAMAMLAESASGPCAQAPPRADRPGESASSGGAGSRTSRPENRGSGHLPTLRCLPRCKGTRRPWQRPKYLPRLVLASHGYLRRRRTTGTGRQRSMRGS